MNGEFDQKEFDRLKKDFEELKAAYYKNNFISQQIFTKDITFKGKVLIGSGESKVGLYGATPVVQAATIADPSGGTTTDTQARNSISTILTALKNIGIIKSS